MRTRTVDRQSEMDEEARSAMVDTIRGHVEDTLRPYVEGDEVAFPMHAHLVVART